MAERIARLSASNKPPVGGLQHMLADEAMLSIGKIVSFWSLLDREVNTAINWFRNHPAVPAEVAAEDPRRELRQRLTYLRKITGYALKEARPNALECYHRNLSKIAACKDIRDALTHGSYNAHPDPEHIQVLNKGRTRDFTAGQLERCAQRITECAGFLSNFSFWLQAPTLQASQGILDGQVAVEWVLLTPAGPSPPPLSGM